MKTAQQEMKNSDNEVSSFHQKMSKAMKSLLAAVDAGTQAMAEVKKDEAADVQVTAETQEVNTKRVKKFDRI